MGVCYRPLEHTTRWVTMGVCYRALEHTTRWVTMGVCYRALELPGGSPWGCATGLLSYQVG